VRRTFTLRRYAGAPAAQEAFRAAKDLLEDKFE